MDVSFTTEEGRFNYRVSAVIIDHNCLLVMKDDNTPYYYLPGGRVKLNETAENAIIRELYEELNLNITKISPIWINQNFFIEEVTKEKFHEICIYFLIDITNTDILKNENNFIKYEKSRKLFFEWCDFNALTSKKIYPSFIIKRVFNIPKSIEIITEYKEN